MNHFEIFHCAWDILVLHAGAADAEDSRTDFVIAFTERRSVQEWRFGGKLGSGGKFWRYDGRYYITCYPEDRTGDRIDLMDKVNHLLSELPYFVPESV